MAMHGKFRKSIIFLISFMLLFLTFLSFFPCESETQSGIIYVTDGDSIQQAINNANEGDTIIVKAGIYHEMVRVNKSVILRGENSETTIIDGDGNVSFPLIICKCDNVIIENFTITNSTNKSGCGGIHVYNVGNVILRNLIITENYNGIILSNSTNITITNCNIKENYAAGIIIHSNAYNNTIAYNDIMNNSIGLRIISGSTFNKIFHNNFIDNGEQVDYLAQKNFFDLGYPFGGNYWSDHPNVDLFNGPDQNNEGSDGIADCQYPIDIGLDKYPLAAPVKTYTVTWDTTKYTIDIISNSTITSLKFENTSKALYLNISGPQETLNFLRISIPKILLSCDDPSEWEILINGSEPISYLALEDSDNTYIYFNYTYAASYVMIKGTNVIPEFSPVLFITFLIITSLAALTCFKRRSMGNPKLSYPRNKTIKGREIQQ